MAFPSFLKQDKDRVLFNQEGELVFYVPESFFSKEIATYQGEYINLLGVLDYAIFDKNGKHGGLKPFKFPSMFTCKPSEIEKLKQVQLTKWTKPQDYRLLKFRKGDEVISSIKVPEAIDNAELFFKLFLYGGLPTTIRYDELWRYFEENMNVNGNKFGLNMQLFGILISEVCRDPNDRNKLFRYTDMKDMCAYQVISIKEVPKNVSAFTSFTSENWDESVVNAISNKNTKFSPLEKLFTI